MFAGASLLSRVPVLPIVIATRPVVSGEEVCSVATDERDRPGPGDIHEQLLLLRQRQHRVSARRRVKVLTR